MLLNPRRENQGPLESVEMASRLRPRLWAPGCAHRSFEVAGDYDPGRILMMASLESQPYDFKRLGP